MEVTNKNEQIIIHPYAEGAYLQYAMATVKDRALCQVQDGQLPVQRRILYDMWELGLLTATKPVKSARVVGDVLGKFHPHGDSAAYGSMVRVAQDFKMRYPLIAGQGNFGSRDGDSAAAMRYTEVKLAPISELLLSELHSDTVDFVDNYDGAFKEPVLLPARLPFGLLNGFTGIAVGMASEGLPHNLREVANAAIALIKNPKSTLDDILALMPGPDFPDGGQLISSKEDIRAAYASGRGVLRMRARWRKEDMARGQWRIIVSELPYSASGKKFTEQVAALTNPVPPKGKKTITQQQATLKQVGLSLLERVTDESSKDEVIRLVVYPRSSKQSADELMAFLFANTCLEESTPLNQTVIGLDGRPTTKNLMEMLSEWVTFRFTTVRRRTTFELNKTNRRIHILEGRKLVYLNVDEVIRVIREAEDPKVDLMTAFSLTEVQADDILEMRLRQLARLEGIKIDKELESARKDAARLTELLDDEKALKKLIIKEIEADRDKFGDDRRTLIQYEARASANGKSIVQSVADEPCTVVLSRNLWIRRLQGHEVDESALTFKEGDEALAIIKTRTAWPIVFMDNTGRVYSVTVSDLPSGRGDGSPLTTLIEVQDGARVLHAMSGDPETQYLFAGERGYGYQAQLKSLVARPKAGKAFLTLEEGEVPMTPLVVPVEATGHLAIGASNTKLLIFPLAEVKILPKGKGVMLMLLEDGEKLTGLQYFEGDVFEGKALIKKVEQTVTVKGEEFKKYLGHRARKGTFAPKKAVIVG